MYICKICGTSSNPGEKQTLKVVKTRPTSYKHMKVINRKKVEIVTRGYETVKEIPVCPRCLKEGE